MKKTFGVLVDWVSGQFQNQILSGIHTFALAHQINVLTFVIGRPGSNYTWEAKRAEALNLLPQLTLDGLIVYTGGMQEFMRQDGFVSLLNKLGKFPMVSVAEIVPRLPSLVCDNKIGFKQLLDYLYGLGHRQFAYAGGPRGYHDSEERRNTFSTFLKAKEILEVEDLFYDGEYNRKSGTEAVRELLDQRKQKFDALVCGDDDIALGAIEELHRRGILVPNDVAVTGFDNIEDSLTASLTTVSQPLSQLGYHAAQTLLDILDNAHVPQVQKFPTRLIKRQSCGGLKFRLHHSQQLPPAGALPLKDFLAQKVPELVELLLGIGLTEDRAKIINAAVVKVLTDFDADSFLQGMVQFLQKEYPHSQPHQAFHSTIAQIRLWILQADLSKDEKLFVETLINHAQLVIADTVQGDSIRQSMHQNYIKQVFSQITNLTFYAKSLGEQTLHLKEFLPHLGIASCHYLLFNNKKDVEAGVRLILSVQDGVERELPAEGLVYSLDDNFPQVLSSQEKPWSYTMEILFDRDAPLGFLLLDPKEKGETLAIIDPLSEVISHGLELSHLVQDLEEKVQQRTEALQQALTDLESYSSQLKELAHHDKGTGLSNRRGFLTLAEHQLKLASRSEKPNMLFWADIDGLGQINDEFGKDQGDEALRTAARLFTAALRAQDLVARVGGDEFVALVSDCNDEIARLLRDRVYRTFEAFNKHITKPWALRMSMVWQVIPGIQIDLDLAQKSMADDLYKEKSERKRMGTQVGTAPV